MRLTCPHNLPFLTRAISTHPECMPQHGLRKAPAAFSIHHLTCIDCDDYGTIATRDVLGTVSGYAYCDKCPAGARRAGIEAARDDAVLVEDVNRAIWPLSLCILASPSSVLTAARPVGLNSRPFAAAWPGRPPG